MKELCTIQVFKEDLENSNLRDFEVKKVEVPAFDYSKYPIWVEQKKVSTKAYKKLKQIEFEIRNKT